MNPFQIKFNSHYLAGDALAEELPNKVLILHGAGQSHRGKMTPLRKELALRKIGSYAFDFIGHGQTGGNLKGSSLRERTFQATEVIKELGLTNKPLSILAASMGAHTATQLANDLKVEKMVLVVPAMYATRAYNVPFGEDFSTIIRTPGSWKDSTGWDIIKNYKGKILIVAGEKDQVIPKEIIDSYYNNAKKAKHRRLYTVPDTGHMLFTELREKDPTELNKVIDAIASTLCES